MGGIIMAIRIFKPGEYAKKEFYSYMGEFFGERAYKKEFPYLVNTENTIWIIDIEEDTVQGFSSFEITNRGIEIGDTYVRSKDKVLWEKLVGYAIEAAESFEPKLIYVAVAHASERDWYQRLGFSVVRTTKNYYFLERVIAEDEEA